MMRKKGKVTKYSVLWMIRGDELVSLEWFVGDKDRNAMGESHGHLLTFTFWMEIRKGSQEGPPAAESP